MTASSFYADGYRAAVAGKPRDPATIATHPDAEVFQ